VKIHVSYHLGVTLTPPDLEEASALLLIQLCTLVQKDPWGEHPLLTEHIQDESKRVPCHFGRLDEIINARELDYHVDHLLTPQPHQMLNGASRRYKIPLEGDFISYSQQTRD
jgi:hypothetical protein